MADFKLSYEKMIRNEGGYQLHKVAGDNGGLTYAGISEKFHPQWQGWTLLKRNPQDPDLTQLVADFYRKNYWQPLHGDSITSQPIAESLFDFGVNAGLRTAVKLAQVVVNTTPDGINGPNTIDKLNSCDEALFISNYALAKIARYANIVTNNASQNKFLLGWINRTLEGLT